MKEQAGIVRFFKRIWQGIKAYLMFIGLLVTLSPFITLYLVKNFQFSMANRSVAPKIPKNFTIDMTLKGQLAEKQTSSGRTIFKKLFRSSEEIYLPDLRIVFRSAARDERVKGIYVNISRLGGSWASFAELRRVMTNFSADSKKPIWVYADDIDDKKLYIASASDKIILAPLGGTTLLGPTFELIYFGEALKKLGVDPQVVKVGKFKNAFEPFTSNIPSKETLEEFQSLAESMRAHIYQSIADSRKVDRKVVDQWFKHSMYTADQAFKEKIIDAINYEQTFKDSFKEEMQTTDVLAWEEFDEKVDHDKFVKQDLANSEDGIGIIEAAGEIHMTGEEVEFEAGQVIDPKSIKKHIDWLEKEEKVKAVVLRISSPGGSALAADIIWNDLKKLAGKKPLVISMGSVAASGGYYMAVAGEKVFAEPTTITGSIGVISLIPNFSAFESKYGVSFHVVTGSDRANLVNPGKKFTEADRQVLENLIQDVYSTFLKRVAEGRNLKVDRVHELAQGRVYTGSQAKDLGLVDEMGGFAEALAYAKEKGGLDPKKLYRVHKYQGEGFSLSDCLKNPLNLYGCLMQIQSRAGIFESLEVQELNKFLNAAGIPLTSKTRAAVLTLLRSQKDLMENNSSAMMFWPSYYSAK